ncbi:2-C-methyl-D-erythritol 4-phosphate cytidylyltransferase [Boudabousia liubingyangii]|uniref:2-C-methyl-D-erythritol 4-phosphate cytidylyltransferase n=1 Tax=Boudabousia liubingyangii TaxID=1921764 RepID=A0A1Q5PK10_9ACTO|nr:2-C-methyl-D-erythritol 4-phosphate cytidylyltransferase [Boudabousia liubingyangii]OKL46553.1 2-C-methyl-D-erythritol 4-phosphate cytidylyltransferase [Boudabousia liubingyangii]
MTREVWVIVTAAGSGSRLGAEVPKALVPLGGHPALTRVLINLSQVEDVTGVIVTHPESQRELFAQAVPAQLPYAIHLVPGGVSRQASVYAALELLSEISPQSLVLVHDAARALTPPAVFERVIEGMLEGAVALVPALPVKDTIKQIRPEAAAEDFPLVLGSPNRDALRAAQTPQGFDFERLWAVHQKARDLSADEAKAAPDDAALMEAFDYPVRIVTGDELALKITTMVDLKLAEILAEEQPINTPQLPFGQRGDLRE